MPKIAAGWFLSPCVSAKAAAVAVELLDDVLPAPEFTPQPADGVTYAEKITAELRRKYGVVRGVGPRIRFLEN